MKDNTMILLLAIIAAFTICFVITSMVSCQKIAEEGYVERYKQLDRKDPKP